MQRVVNAHSAPRALRLAARSFARATPAAAATRFSLAPSARAVHTRGLPLLRALSPIGVTRSFSAVAGGVGVGDRVALEMTGKLGSGVEFGKTETGNPLSFIVGRGEVLPGVELAVRGMIKGDAKSVEIAPENAFGKDKQVFTVPLKEMNLPAEEKDKMVVGSVLELNNGERARIVKVTEETIDIDVSHPYAGETLFVDLKIVDHVPRAQLTAAEQLVLPQDEVAPGDGVSFPRRGDTLVMHYTGSLAADGSVFDSSRDRGEPFRFQIGVGQVIQGWDEGVMQMSKGQRAKLHIPADKGYGKSGAGDAIPPNADLVFDVELLDILRP